MFRNLIDAQIAGGTEFWNAYPLAKRIDRLRQGRPRIAWLYEKPDTSTFRYRCFNPSMTLASLRPDIGAAWFVLEEMPTLFAAVSDLDVLVVCRVRYDARIARFISYAIAQGCRVLFDCDDLVFDSRYVHLIIKTLDQPDNDHVHWDFWHGYIGRIEATARLCHGGISTNAFLASHLDQIVKGRSCAIVPNYLAPEQENLSRQLLKAKREQGFVGDGEITIGYFSGTPTHNNDFAIAAPALSRVLARDDKTRLRIVGFPPPHPQLKDFGNRIEVVSLQDYLNLQRLIAEVEINIAPLQDNEFTNCKSELKYFEAAAVGTWTIATPTHAFRHAIHNGTTGRLAYAHEWDEALTEALALVRDPAQYAPIAEIAAEECYARYGWDKQADLILAATCG